MSKGFTAVDLATCAKYLKMVEEHGLRRPKPTYVATRLLLDNPARAKLTKRDQYARMETHAVAALDLGDVESARRVVSSLRNVFPESLRLDRLEAMCLEAQGDHDAALKAYDAILERSPAEQRAMKRRASCLRAAGRPKPPSTRWWNIWTRSWRTWTRGRLSRGYTRNCACTSRRCSAGRRCSWRSRRSRITIEGWRRRS